MIFKMGELFCGPGGIAYGATQAKVDGYSIEHAWANDYDENTCETYRANICPDNPKSVIHGDVRKLDLTTLGPIDLSESKASANSALCILYSLQRRRTLLIVPQKTYILSLAK